LANAFDKKRVLNLQNCMYALLAANVLHRMLTVFTNVRMQYDDDHMSADIGDQAL
jgi:hypothetical protein